MTAATDNLTWNVEWGVRKYDEDDVARLVSKLGREPVAADFEQYGVTPYESNVVPRNLLTTAGLGRITSLITGAGGQAATNTASRIGVGDGAGTAAIGDTDLSAAAGSTHRQFVVMDATFPTTSGGLMTFQSSFTSALGNFAWNEFGIDVAAGASNGTTVNALLLNHKTSIAQGTKTAGQTWVASAAITLS